MVRALENGIVKTELISKGSGPIKTPPPPLKKTLASDDDEDIVELTIKIVKKRNEITTVSQISID